MSTRVSPWCQAVSGIHTIKSGGVSTTVWERAASVSGIHTIKSGGVSTLFCITTYMSLTYMTFSHYFSLSLT